MVNLGNKLDEVYRAHLLPLGLAPPAKPPRVCDGSCGAAGKVIDSIAIAPGSERQQRQDSGLSRSQRRSKVAKERRDRVAALEAEAALLRAKLARRRRYREEIMEKARDCGLVMPVVVVDFLRRLDCRLMLD
jgi:hypothetical protein